MRTSSSSDASGHGPRRRNPVATWGGIALIVAIGLTLFSLRRHLISRPDPTIHHAVGEQLGSFEVVPLSGTDAPLDSDQLRGRVVLFDLWGPWCPPCRRELPALAELAETLASNHDFRFVAVAVPYEASEQTTLADDVQRFLQGHGLNLAVYADPDRSLRMAAQRAGVYTGSFPTTWLIDRQGTIRAVWKGFLPGAVDDMKRLAEQLLDEPRPST